MTDSQIKTVLEVCDEMLVEGRDLQSLVVKGGKFKESVFLEMRLYRMDGGKIASL